jgi:hypothetical protein
MDILTQLGKFLDGKKTYLVAVLVGVAAALQSLGITIPDYVWTILAALGLGAVRSSIGNK